MEGTAFYQGPGFRFHPTDEEIVRYYLKKKLTGNLPSCFDYLAVIDIYKFEPWDLPKMSKLKTRDLEWYFFTALDKKYGNSIRTNRATDRGYWKTTGKDRAIKNGEETVGMKKTLVYHLGRAPHGDRSNWVMHEYRMIDETLAKAGVQDAYVLCRIFEKSGSGPKNGEKYGAPFVEEEWENFGEQVLPLPPVDNEPLKLEGFTPDVDELVNPLAVSVPDDVLVDPLDAFYDELWKENVPDSTYEDFFETHDLDQDIDTSNTVGSAELQSNFCYGECSTHPQYSQAFINEHEYLACPDDDDVSKYICLDSPLNARSESPIPSYGQPIIEQNVEGETYGSSLTNKHVFEAQSCHEDLPKEDLAAPNWVSGDANTFVKHANRLLANIPAPPAFASEFPAKELACGTHPAAESSNSAHITAGMISITDITFRGNAMDWMVGKNGASPWVLYLSCCCPSYSFQRKILDVGFSHTNILRSIVHHACLRFPNLASVSGISSQIPSRSKSSEPNKSFPHREGAQKVFVIFGGDTSERQVSLMSGTNVWLNLLGFNDSLLRLITGNSAYNLNEETDVAPFEHLYLPN